MKKLSEMSLDELWHLFPVSLVPHNEAWRDWFCEESFALTKILPGFKFYHIGSTAIPKIYSKNIVDILGVAEVRESDEILNGENHKVCVLENAKKILCPAGWICMNCSANRISFNKGYTEQGFAERVFHLHLRKPDDVDELLFCDYLCKNPDVAKEYEILKLSLSKKFEFNRDGYTEAKGDFIQKIMKRAKMGSLDKVRGKISCKNKDE